MAGIQGMRIALALLILFGSLSVGASELDDTKALADAGSDVGDVYYCTTIRHVQIDKDGQMVTISPESFNFKMTEELIVFGETEIIDNSLS